MISIEIPMSAPKLSFFQQYNAALWVCPNTGFTYWKTEKMYQHDVCILTAQEAIDLLSDFYGYEVDIDLLTDLDYKAADTFSLNLEEHEDWRFHYEDGKWSIR